MLDVTETIKKALASVGLGTGPGPTTHRHDDSVIDVAARVVESPSDAFRQAGTPPVVDQPAQPGQFVSRNFSSGAGSRAYKLYLPELATSEPMPLIVMLHGCTQSADDFAAGTQMNRLADAHGFLVVYPEQAAQANASKCWNWFKPQDQARGAGEPAMIASIVREVAQKYHADPGRIFVAGLSAGAAMAVVLGETYPELFSGVGAHSGLAYGSAHDIPSALAAMKGGRSGLPGRKKLAGDSGVGAGAGAARRKAVQAVPVIVFHGDRDQTVQQKNGAHIVQQAVDAHSAQAGDAGLRANTQSGVAAGGRRFSRTLHTDAAGQTRVESWTVHGAGHAWSGGHASGSYTDGAGPDASAEMVRFFMALPTRRC